MLSSKIHIVALVFCALLSHPSFAQLKEFIEPAADSPLYEISNIRTSKEWMSKDEITFDYIRTREGPLDFIIVGVRNKDGSTSYGGAIMGGGRGTHSVPNLFFNVESKDDFEVFIYMPDTWMDYISRNQLISNVIRKGNPHGETKGRAWTAQEKEAYAKNKLGMKAPSKVPDGHVAVTMNTKLVPGVPVMAWQFGDWVQGEVVSLSMPQVIVHFDASQKNKRFEIDAPWLAISNETVRAVQSNPNQFSTKIHLAWGSLIAMPPGVVRMPDLFKPTEGMPVFAEIDEKWIEVPVISARAGSIKLNSKDHRISSRDYGTMDLGIAEEVLARSKDPKAIAQWEKEAIEEEAASVAAVKPWDMREYPIKLPIPISRSVVPEDLQLEYGTVMYVCYLGGWVEVHARADNGDGTVHVHFKGEDNLSDRFVQRSDLTIDNATVGRLWLSNKRKLLPPGGYLVQPSDSATDKAEMSPAARARDKANRLPATQSPPPAAPVTASKEVKPRPAQEGNYPVTIPVPAGYATLPADVPVANGTALYACYANKWYEVYCRADNRDGTIHIKWKDWSSDSWDCDLARTNLVIANAVLAKLKAQQKRKAESANAARTWSDKSGKFKITATLSSRTATEVILLTSEGKKVTVKIDKLSPEDQEYLSKVPEASATK